VQLLAKQQLSVAVGLVGQIGLTVQVARRQPFPGVLEARVQRVQALRVVTPVPVE